ncbi:MAG: aspartate--tRNA ligase [Holosporales bacterium]|jgi:aspartyl-tRNA synthetase|nr:aspartate--tRNA ligase [Holosporales bacterium]
MHEYRTCNCNAVDKNCCGKTVKLAGWVHRKRDHGNLLFIDLRDHFGITQCVTDVSSPIFKEVEQLSLESVVSFSGEIRPRPADTVNLNIPTGEVEMVIAEAKLLSPAATLPFSVNIESNYPEDIRLKYRFLDLRRESVHRNIVLRSQVIASLRRRMQEAGFLEVQTPILTASSPEGARDYLVPSRIHPGKFYALPQAPQMFKQLLMVAGFDRYFQVAPCFRDEDSRAERSPGEFYQLDLEMAFVTQEDIFATIEPVLHGVFAEFSSKSTISPYPFRRIPYDQSLLRYGTDKPDLRNPLEIVDLTELFKQSSFEAFTHIINNESGLVRGIKVDHVAEKSRSFFDKLNEWAQDEGMPGLGYILLKNNEFKGPIAKFLNEDQLKELSAITKLADGGCVFFICAKPKAVWKLAGMVRIKLAQELELIDANRFEFCWITDFPMYEFNEDTKKIEFSHNPFSMPQGGLEALNSSDPLQIKAYQYDVVCNGVELSSGAIRNHLPEVMFKAFAIAGYSNEDVEKNFGGMLNAFRYGAPPHGGCAPGIDRMVMLLANEPNIREVIAFPVNQQAQDLMMNAPAEIDPARLKELHIRTVLPSK